MFYFENYGKITEMLKRSKFFDKVEVNVISAMLELESMGKVKNTASEIARKAGLNVTNAYKYLYNLAKLGIVDFEEEKQKLFWLSRVNPFPRIIALITSEYLERKAALTTAQKFYERLIVSRAVSEKPRIRKFSEDFELVCAYVADVAKKELCVIADFVPEDFVVLDAWRRCEERNVEMRWLACELPEEKARFLEKIGFQIRYTYEIIYPFIMVSDEKYGVVVETMDKEIKGFFFLNCENDFKENFEKWWEDAGEIR